MKVLKSILEYLKKIFFKKQPKMLQESNNQIKNVGNNTKEKFVEQLKVKNRKSTNVETEICVQNGLGFEGKIKG